MPRRLFCRQVAESDADAAHHTGDGGDPRQHAHDDVDHAGHSPHHLGHAGGGIEVVALEVGVEGAFQGGLAFVDGILVQRRHHIAGYPAKQLGGGGIASIVIAMFRPENLERVYLTR